MLNADLIKTKIDYIIQDLARLSSYKDISFQEYSDDQMIQATIERFLERIVNRALDINQHIILMKIQPEITNPIEYFETFIALSNLKIYDKAFADEIAKSAGFRNMLAHNYDDMDPKIIFDSIQSALEHYPKYCSYILKFLEKENN
ncbi:MAG: DUF86 domain-containing protein [Candidatus Roizmanbacteria bacterium]|nr:DUF86 domain-containing protein [Candidatus Roizmanbacteria bacterium]